MSSSYGDGEPFLLDLANLFINKIFNLGKRLGEGFLDVGAGHALSANMASVLEKRALT